MSLTIKKDHVPRLARRMKDLLKMDVLVGVPSENAPRKSDGSITNAEIAYIQDHGAPDANIPARPFMAPGIERAQDKIQKYLKQGLDSVLAGDRGRAGRALGAAGMSAQSSIRTYIQAGIAPNLAPSTLKARAARARKKNGISLAKGAQAQLATGDISTTPLIDTGQMLKSITYVIRTDKKLPDITELNEMEES